MSFGKEHKVGKMWRQGKAVIGSAGSSQVVLVLILFLESTAGDGCTQSRERQITKQEARAGSGVCSSVTAAAGGLWRLRCFSTNARGPMTGCLGAYLGCHLAKAWAAELHKCRLTAGMTRPVKTGHTVNQKVKSRGECLARSSWWGKEKLLHVMFYRRVTLRACGRPAGGKSCKSELPPFLTHAWRSGTSSLIVSRT